MRFNFLSTIAALIVTSAAIAEVVTVDFNNNNGCAPEFVSSGVKITNGRGTICFSISGINSVSNGTYFTNDVENLRVVNVDGDIFTPISADLAEYSISVGAPDPVKFVGQKPSGDTVVFEVILDNIADGSNGVEDFQTIFFPPEFTDIISLESPTRRWSLDNLKVDTIPPPPLPANQGLEPSYANAEFIRSQIGVIDRNLVIGTDFAYITGFFSPQKVIFLSPGGFSFSASSPYYDTTSGFVVYGSGDNIYRRSRSTSSIVESLVTVQAEGYEVSSIGSPILRGDRMIFEGYNLTGDDAYYIFESVAGNLTSLVGPSTLLPNEIGGFSHPHYFPDHRAIGDGAYAFETSLQGSISTIRVYVKWGENDFDLVLSEGDSTIFGNITGVEGLAFNADNNLIVDASVSGAFIRLRYDSNGIVNAISRSITTNPINAGLSVSGVTESSLQGKRFLLSGGVLYHETDGAFYKVIGVGDRFSGSEITDLRFLGAPEGSPERVIVDLAFDGNFSRREHYLITLNDPVDAPPRIGKPLLYPENGKFYIPLSHLTIGKTYDVEVSIDLIEWNFQQTISDIAPLQFVIIEPPLPNPKAFYRIKENNP